MKYSLILCGLSIFTYIIITMRKTTVILTIINLSECTIISCPLLSTCLNSEIGIRLDFNIDQRCVWKNQCNNEFVL